MAVLSNFHQNAIRHGFVMEQASPEFCTCSYVVHWCAFMGIFGAALHLGPPLEVKKIILTFSVKK